jgi:hypothetical protein
VSKDLAKQQPITTPNVASCGQIQHGKLDPKSDEVFYEGSGEFSSPAEGIDKGHAEHASDALQQNPVVQASSRFGNRQVPLDSLRHNQCGTPSHATARSVKKHSCPQSSTDSPVAQDRTGHQRQE